MIAVPRYRIVRYAGLIGAVLLAVSAQFGGVLPRWQAAVTPVSIWQGEHGPLILSCWLLGTALLAGAWWAARDGVPSTRWAYVTVGLWLLPLLAVPPLGSRDVYSYACQGAVLRAGGNPYTTGVRELGCPWLASVSPTWQDSPAPYGPVFVLLAGLAVAVGGTLAGTLAMLRLYALLGVGLTALCLPALARRCGVPPQRALWLLLGCPIVAVHLVSGAHNDALMVGLVAAGLLVAVARPGRPLPLFAAGVLLGLAVGVKATAGVVVPFAMLAALAGPYRTRTLLRDGAPVAAGAAFAVLAVTGASGLGWGWVDGLARSGDSVQWTSPSTAFGLTVDYAGRLFGARPGRRTGGPAGRVGCARRTPGRALVAGPAPGPGPRRRVGAGRHGRPRPGLPPVVRHLAAGRPGGDRDSEPLVGRTRGDDLVSHPAGRHQSGPVQQASRRPGDDRVRAGPGAGSDALRTAAGRATPATGRWSGRSRPAGSTAAPDLGMRKPGPRCGDPASFMCLLRGVAYQTSCTMCAAWSSHCAYASGNADP